MGLQPTTDSAQSGKVIFQKVLETVRGGFALDTTGFSEGDVILAGSPVIYDETTRIAKVLKTARMQANGSGTSYPVYKGHNLKVGEYVGGTVGGAAYAITAIDTSNAAYDVLTLGTTIGAVAAEAGIFQSSATGASAAALKHTPKGLLYDDVVVGTDDSLSVVVRGTVYARRAPAVTATVVSGLPLIIFSNSY